MSEVSIQIMNRMKKEFPNLNINTVYNTIELDQIPSCCGVGFMHGMEAFSWPREARERYLKLAYIGAQKREWTKILAITAVTPNTANDDYWDAEDEDPGWQRKWRRSFEKAGYQSISSFISNSTENKIRMHLKHVEYDYDTIDIDIETDPDI